MWHDISLDTVCVARCLLECLRSKYLLYIIRIRSSRVRGPVVTYRPCRFCQSQDSSGYPEQVGRANLELITNRVSIAYTQPGRASLVSDMLPERQGAVPMFARTLRSFSLTCISWWFYLERNHFLTQAVSGNLEAITSFDMSFLSSLDLFVNT